MPSSLCSGETTPEVKPGSILYVAKRPYDHDLSENGVG
jgi:hypothetical protein